MYETRIRTEERPVVEIIGPVTHEVPADTCDARSIRFDAARDMKLIELEERLARLESALARLEKAVE